MQCPRGRGAVHVTTDASDDRRTVSSRTSFHFRRTLSLSVEEEESTPSLTHSHSLAVRLSDGAGGGDSEVGREREGGGPAAGGGRTEGGRRRGSTGGASEHWASLVSPSSLSLSPLLSSRARAGRGAGVPSPTGPLLSQNSRIRSHSSSTKKWRRRGREEEKGAYHYCRLRRRRSPIFR